MNLPVMTSPHFTGIAVAQIRPRLRARTVEHCQVIEPGSEDGP